MSAFEFVFSLFGLLLGLSLVEVLAGLVRTVKARKAVRLGWLTPLLGIFVMLHLTSFWTDAWEMREHIPATDGALFVGLLLAGLYYFAASMVFPERPDECPDLDDYYFAHKRQVLAGVLICDAIISTTKHILVPSTTLDSYLIGLAIALAFFTAAVFVRGKRLNIVMLAVLILPLIIGAALGR